jgi:hypothetical protein
MLRESASYCTDDGFKSEVQEGLAQGWVLETFNQANHKHVTHAILKTDGHVVNGNFNGLYKLS